jgi:hypothetical protein
VILPEARLRVDRMGVGLGCLRCELGRRQRDGLVGCSIDSDGVRSVEGLESALGDRRREMLLCAAIAVWRATVVIDNVKVRRGDRCAGEAHFNESGMRNVEGAVCMQYRMQMQQRSTIYFDARIEDPLRMADDVG